MRKFVAEWVVGVSEFDTPIFQYATLSSEISAIAHARNESKKANAMEFIAVTEFQWVGHKITGYWEPVRRLSGDYDFVEETL